MAAGIVRASLYFDVNGKQAVQEVRNVQKSVQQFQQTANRGFSQTQQVAQQAVFAVDDFVAAFSTGGVAGGLRGAANNLTLIASLLGGIKVQLLVIAGLAGAQLLASYFSRAGKEAEKATDKIKEAANEQLRQLEYAEEISRIQAAGGRGTFRNEGTSEQAFGRAGDANERRKALQEEIRLAEAARREYKLANPTGIDLLTREERNADRKEEIQKTIDLFDERIRKKKEELRLTKEEIKVQNILGRELKAQEEANRLANTAPGTPGGLFGFGADSVTGVGGLLRKAKGLSRFDPLSTFGLLPSANVFGSVGAVSSINSAIGGSNNVEDATLRETRNVARNTADISRKLGGKLHSLVEVSL